MMFGSVWSARVKPDSHPPSPRSHVENPPPRPPPNPPPPPPPPAESAAVLAPRPPRPAVVSFAGPAPRPPREADESLAAPAPRPPRPPRPAPESACAPPRPPPRPPPGVAKTARPPVVGGASGAVLGPRIVLLSCRFVRIQYGTCWSTDTWYIWPFGIAMPRNDLPWSVVTRAPASSVRPKWSAFFGSHQMSWLSP